MGRYQRAHTCQVTEILRVMQALGLLYIDLWPLSSSLTNLTATSFDHKRLWFTSIIPLHCPFLIAASFCWVNHFHIEHSTLPKDTYFFIMAQKKNQGFDRTVNILVIKSNPILPANAFWDTGMTAVSALNHSKHCLQRGGIGAAGPMSAPPAAEGYSQFMQCWCLPFVYLLDTAKTQVSPDSDQAGSDLTHIAVFQKPHSLVKCIITKTTL